MGELLIPLIVLYGIFGGHAKLVETAAFTVVVYVFIIETFVYKDIKVNDSFRIIISCATLVECAHIIGSAMGLTSYMVDAQIPMSILSVYKGNHPFKICIFNSSKYLSFNNWLPNGYF